MSRDEYAELLNRLLESERAGAQLLAAYGEDLPPGSERRAWLGVLQRDEARNCSTLIRLLREQGVEPSSAVGESYRNGLQVRGWAERLAFLDRAQQALAGRIAGALPQLARFGEARQSLGGMLGSHLVNINVCRRIA
jgi:hypothetical protein